MISVFTPSWADADNTNAQNLTVKEVVSRLDPNRFHVTMYRGGEPDRRLEERPNTVLIPWRRHGNTLGSLARLLRERPDVFFYPRETYLELVFCRLKRMMPLRTRIVCHVVRTLDRDGSPPRSVADRALAAVIGQAERVFGNSSYVSHTVRERFGTPVDTIHNGIDTRYFYPARRLDGDVGCRRVLFAGSFQARKRPWRVIELARQFPEIVFSLAGSGEELERCQQLARDGCCSNVRFLGHLHPRDLGDEMRASNIFVFPSIGEGHPQVLGQAAACGLPCLAMDLYRPDYVVHGQTGFLARNDDEFDSFVRLLVESSELRRQFGDAASAHAKGFDWDKAAGRWAGVLEDVAGGIRRRGTC